MATITQTSIGLPPPLGDDEVSLALEVAPSFQTMGLAATNSPPTLEKEPESTIFVNTKPTLPEALEYLAKAKAAEAADARRKEGKLPTGSDTESVVKRSNYNIRVIEYAMQHSAWLSTRGSTTASKNFTVKKDQLHAEIIKTVLAGLNLPEGVEGNFEKIMLSISDGLKKEEDQKTDQNKWITIATYEYNAVQKKVFAGIRTIYFSITQKLVDYNDSKNDKGKNANLDLAYQQIDYSLNESVYDTVRDKVVGFNSNTAGTNIATIVNIAV